MEKKSGMIFVFLFLLFPQVVFPQGLGEYGRLLGGLGQKNASGVSKGVTPGTEIGGNMKQRSPDSGGADRNPLPPVLVVESNEAVLYARSEEWADKMMQLSRGDKLTPMVQATGANALWYMVKTQTGSIGWVKSTDVSSAPIKGQ